MNETSGVALALRTGVPSYQVEDEEGKTHLLIHLPNLHSGARELGFFCRIFPSVADHASDPGSSGTASGP